MRTRDYWQENVDRMLQFNDQPVLQEPGVVNAPTPGLDYGDDGYDPGQSNVGVNPATGLIQLEIKGLAEPKSLEAERICHEDLTELVTAFVQDKQAIERGMSRLFLRPLSRSLRRQDGSTEHSGHFAAFAGRAAFA